MYRMFFLSLAFLMFGWVFFLSESFAEDASAIEIESNLISTIESMGYIDIEVDECALTFSRSIVPSEINNSAYKYTRSVHLDTIDWGIEPKILELSLDTGKYYRYYSLELLTLKSYYEKYRESISFRIWVRERYPLAKWPYEHPKFHDQFTSVLEAKAKLMIADFADMNSWTDFSSFGGSTRFPQNFEVGFHVEGPLIDLSNALQRYSRKVGCDS
jgi:hypothetical protein